MEIRVLGPGDDHVLALDDGLVVGFASGVHYVHPDKPPSSGSTELVIAVVEATEESIYVSLNPRKPA